VNHRKGPQKGRHFTIIYDDLLKSQAFKNLNNSSRVSLLLIKSQVVREGQTEVKLPYSDIEGYMDRNTFSNSTLQLKEFGFIDISSEGGLYRKTNVYKLSDRWREIKEPRITKHRLRNR
jgi:hypothetical protein